MIQKLLKHKLIYRVSSYKLNIQNIKGTKNRLLIMTCRCTLTITTGPKDKNLDIHYLKTPPSPIPKTL